MSDLPPPDTSVHEFFEVHVPRAFAANPLPEEAHALDVLLGVLLEGEGGGSWRLHLNAGDLSVAAGAVEEAAFSLVQSVADWRGALWEGRGGAIGRQAQAMFQPGAGGAFAGPLPGALPAAALDQMKLLRGLIRVVVSGGEGGDWAVGFKLGPGALPEEPTTTVTVAAADLDALERGELDPMQAFMSGKILVAGDMTLLMQMQAIAMQAQALAQAAKPIG